LNLRELKADKFGERSIKSPQIVSHPTLKIGPKGPVVLILRRCSQMPKDSEIAMLMMPLLPAVWEGHAGATGPITIPQKSF